MTTSIFWASDSEQYAGFWSRFGAQILDALILLPFAAVRVLLFRTRTTAMLAFIPLLLFEVWFFVNLVYRYGGTPGKLILGIRIRSDNGESVTLKQAFLRHAPSLALGAISAISIAMALSQVSDGMYDATSWMNRPRLLSTFAPHWSRYVSLLAGIWSWSELAVMLTNPERRALHDFIAGTIVIKQEYVALVEAAARQPSPAVP
jgi:uncharacterized RDD family membrane protein YckC